MQNEKRKWEEASFKEIISEFSRTKKKHHFMYSRSHMNPNQDKQKEIHTEAKYNENAEHKRKREDLQ